MPGELAIGVEIAGHRVESVIGHGGMGVVYLAEHLRLGRKVALKVLNPSLAEDDSFRRRFVRESQLAASLDHPNIITIYDAGEVDGVLYISMRYVKGAGLDEVLRASKTLSPVETLWALEHVAAALDVAHGEGLVHRDVKPGNVLLRRRGDRATFDHVYLTDFGITKSVRGGTEQTQTSQFVGTIDYTAPEQISGGPIDGRTDVYSLGCLLYQCLVGQVPYRAESLIQVMYAHLQEAPPTITAVRDDLPAELDAVVRRALAKRPDDRFGTCTELVGAYREAIDVAPGGERAITAPPSMEGDELRPVSGDGRTIRPPTRSMTPVLEGQRKLVPSRRRVRFWAALSVALVIAGAATAWGLVLQRGGVGPTPGTPPRTRSSPPARQGRIVWQPAVRNPIFRRPDPQVIVRAISTPTGIVAVGYQGSGPTVDPVVWRFDGSSWTRFRVFAGPYGQGIAGVAKGGPGLVGVGTDYSGPDTDAAVWVSRDGGQSWDRVSRGPLTSSGDEYMVRVVKGGPGLVAVGWEKAPNGNTDASVWTSGDSRLWAGVDSATFGGPGEQKMLSAVRFRSGIVAVGDSVVGGNMDAAAWRYDGTNYVRSHSKSLHEPGKQLMAAVAAGPDGLVAVGFDESGPDRDAAVWRSRDGLHWSRVPSRVFGGPDFQEMQGVAWTHAGYVAVGRDVPAGATWSSTDGRHWQEQRPLRLDDRFPRLSAVVEFRGKLYALGRAVLHGDVDAAVWPGKVVHSR